MAMHKTMVSVTQSQIAFLREESQKRQISIADMLRRIIDEYRDIRKESRSTMSDAFPKNNGSSRKPTVVEMVLAGLEDGKSVSDIRASVEAAHPGITEADVMTALDTEKARLEASVRHGEREQDRLKRL